MSKTEKWLLGLSLAALLVGMIALLSGGKTITNTATEKTIREVVGAAAGGDFGFPVIWRDRVTKNYDFLATTTPSALTGHTLGSSDFNNPQKLRVVTLGGQKDTNYAFTLPASSSLTNIAPNAGDREEVCYYVTASTSKHMLTFVGATGVDLTIATTTVTGIAQANATSTGAGIPQNGFGCLDFFRKPRSNANSANFGQPGNLSAEMKFRVNADATTND